MGAGFENMKVPHEFVKEFTMFCKNDSRIQEHLPAPAHRPCGGSWGGSRIRPLVRLCAFERAGVRRRVQAGMVAAARIGWIEVGCLRVRNFGVRLGIQRGKIVDSAGCLGVGLP